MAEELVQTVELSTLEGHPDNPRRGDVPAIMRSLERFGQVKPIVVQASTRYIVAGNHTAEAASRLGWTTVKALILDMDDETARAYLIADNRTGDKSTYDKGVLNDVLGKVLMLDGTGFDEDDLELLQEELSGTREVKRSGGSSEKIEVESSEAEGDGPEPMREIPLVMTASQVAEFTDQVQDLQQLWEARTLVEIVVRAVTEAHQRWQASVGVDPNASSVNVIPEAATTF